MQFEHITQYQHHRTPNKQELFTSLENAKLNTRIEGDEDHMSQLSTLQSLGNLDSHATPEKASTPNSGKNLLASAEQKLGQAKDFVSRKSSIWTDEMSRKASGIKGKIVEKFGEEIQPEKDLDENVKEQIKEVNEEIKQIPHGEEEIVEGQGQAAPKNNVLGKKVKKAKNKVKAAVRDLKPKSGRVMKKGFMKVYQVKEKIKQGAELVKENVSEMPKKEVEEAELMRKSSGSGVEDLKNISNDILSQALSKIEAMRIKAHNQTQLIQEQLHDMSAKSSSDKSTELKSAELKSPSGLGVDELITMSRSLIDILDDALGKVEKMKIEDKNRRNEEESERRGEIYKITNQINEILEELKSTDQVPYEKMTVRVESVQKENNEHHHLSTGSPSFEPVQESPSHHHLSAESQSFQPTQESHNLIKKVTTGLNRHVPLTKIVEKLDHQKNYKSQGPSRTRPAKETCYVLMQNIGGGMEELEPLVDKEEEIEEQGQLKPELSPNLQEISRQGLDQIQHCIEEAFTRLAEQAESARRKLENVMNEEITLETRETESSQDKSPSSLEAVKESVQEIPEKISDKIEEIREDIVETKEEGRDDKQELKEEETHERRPLIDKIMDSIHSVNDNLHQRVEYVKQAFKVEEKTRESQPLLDVMSEKIHHITSKIPHKTESGEDNTELPQEEQEITEEVPELPQEQEESRELPKEKNPFLRQKVAEKLDQISHKISENIEHLKERLRTKKHDEEDAEGTEEFHEVKDGFYETVTEYKQETEIRPEELVSENMFQNLEEREQEPEPEHKSLFQRIKGRFIKEKDVTEEEEEEEEEIHDVVEDTPDLRRDISEDVESFKARALKGKEEALVETMEERADELPSEAVHEENHSLKERISEKIHDLSDRISQKVSNIKHVFTSEKEVPEKQEDEDTPVADTITLSADDLKKEQIFEPLLSNNPFEVLATKDANLVQPLESGEVVGGDLQELTGEEKPEFKEDGLYEEIEDDDEDEENGQKKSLFSRILEAFSRKNKVNMV